MDQGGAYFRTGHVARGVAFGDLDNDGGIDLVICHTNEPVALLRNRVFDRGHWLGIELVGRTCRDSVGAKLTLEAGGRTLTRFVLGGGSYLSTNDRRVVFGLGGARAVQSLSVRWPSGRTQTWNAGELTVGRYNKLVEGDEKTEVR